MYVRPSIYVTKDAQVTTKPSGWSERPAPRLLVLGLVSIVFGWSGPVDAAPNLSAKSGRLHLQVEDMTRGIRFAGPFTSLAQSSSDPNRLYLGTRDGRVHVSRDGGLNWEEVQIHTKRSLFVGAIRGYDTSFNDLTRPTPFGGLSKTRLYQSYLPSRLFDPEITTGTDALPPSTAFFGGGDELSRATRGLSPGRLRDPVQGLYRGTIFGQDDPSRLGAGGSGRGGGNDLAVGIRARAPWLAYQVRRKKGWAIGISLIQNLVLRGNQRIEVRYLSINEKNPDDVLAATADGLYHTKDGGYTWALVLTSPDRGERDIRFIVRHPSIDGKVFVGTSGGLRVSTDAGETWRKVTHRLVEGSGIYWLEFDPRDEKRLFVGRRGGAVLSEDGGQTFRLIYISPWPPLNHARALRPDPEMPNRIWMATDDGLLKSDNAGKSFTRVGGLMFTGRQILRIIFGRRSGEIYITSEDELWRSADRGESWVMLPYGARSYWIEMLALDNGDGDSLLMLTEHEILRLSGRSRMHYPPALVAEYKRWLYGEPKMSVAVKRALIRAGLYRADIMQFRRNSMKANLLPSVYLMGKLTHYDTNRAFRNPVVDPTRSLEDRWANATPSFVGLYLSWDLEKTVFRNSQTLARRVARGNLRAEKNLRRQVMALIEERRRLIFDQFVNPQSQKDDFYRKLRLEELTTHLNFLTGDMFPPFSAF